MLQVGPAGSPTGGEHCFTEPGRPDACYPTEQERASGQSRRAAELERAQRDERAAELAKQDATAESPQARYLREEEEKRAAEAKARDDAYAERRRKDQEKADAKAARAAELKRLAADPEVAGRAISAIMCSIDAEVVRLRGELDKEKRTSAVSGAVDLRARHDIAAEIVSDTDELKGWEASLKRLGAKRSPCSEVGPLVACRNSIESCDPANRDAVEVWDKEQATLWGSDAERPFR